MSNLTILTKHIRQFDGLYSLNDLHKASGGKKKYKPSNFVRLSQTKELISEIMHPSHLRSGQCSDVSTALRVINGGVNRGTYICKELVYSYAMWVSAEFQLAVIRAFDKLQSGTYERDNMSPDNQYALSQTVKRVAEEHNFKRTEIWDKLKDEFKVTRYTQIDDDWIEEAIQFVERLPDMTRSLAAPSPLDGRYIAVMKGGHVVQLKPIGEKVIIDPKVLLKIRDTMNTAGKDLQGLSQTIGDLTYG